MVAIITKKLEEVPGTYGRPVFVADFKMQVGTRRDARGSDVADELVKPDMLSFMNQNFGKMPVARKKNARAAFALDHMFDLDHVPVAAHPPRIGHDAFAGG